MSGNKLLIDSNIAIYLPKRDLLIGDFVQSGDILYVSLVTYREVVGYKFTNEVEESFTNSLFSLLQSLPVTKSVAGRVVGYRKLHRIKLPDAIILGTAREYDCQLVTRNVSDFVGIDERVTIINPFDK